MSNTQNIANQQIYKSDIKIIAFRLSFVGKQGWGDQLVFSPVAK